MNFWLIIIAYTFYYIQHGIIFPLIPLLAEELGATPSIIGFTVGAFSLIAVFLSIPLGGLVDRFGIKRLFLLGVICNILVAAILIVTDTVSKLIAAQMVGGVAFLLHVIASQAFFSHLPNPAEREKGFGSLSLGAAVGLSIGPALGGFLVVWFDYQAAFLAVLLLSGTGIIVLGLQGTKELHPTKLSYNIVQDIRQAGMLTMDSRVLTILAFTFVIIFAVNLRASFLPVHLRAQGLTEATVGLLISIFAVTSTAIRLLFGRLLEIFKRKNMVALSMLAIVFGIGLIPSTFSVTGLAIVLSVLGLGFGITQPLSMVMIADLADSNVSGLAMGLRFTFIMAANLLSPIFFGFWVDMFGLNSAFYIAAFLVVLVGFQILLIRPELIPDRRE
jgi:MFS family permease